MHYPKSAFSTNNLFSSDKETIVPKQSAFINKVSNHLISIFNDLELLFCFSETFDNRGFFGSILDVRDDCWAFNAKASYKSLICFIYFLYSIKKKRKRWQNKTIKLITPRNLAMKKFESLRLMTCVLTTLPKIHYQAEISLRNHFVGRICDWKFCSRWRNLGLNCNRWNYMPNSQLKLSVLINQITFFSLYFFKCFLDVKT